MSTETLSNSPTDTASPSSPPPRLALRWAAFVIGAVLIVLFATSFIVRENETALVLRFGQPIRTLSAAGWYGKLPSPIDRVVRLDARLQQGEIRLSEAITRDKRNVIVPLFFSWRVADPMRFLTRVGDISSATEKLDAILTSARNAALGQQLFDQLVSIKGDHSLAALEESVLRAAQPDAANNLGIALVNVGVLQINLPQANTESVFRRMRAERKREASQYRAEGRAQAETVRAETDRETAILLADAKRYAEETRGNAEADAARIYAAAHGQDVEFYDFLRQLQSLRSVVDRNTTLILDTDSAPFALLKHGPSMKPGSSPLIAPVSSTAATAAVLDPR
jgi:membrane protease subunit HflC